MHSEARPGEASALLRARDELSRHGARPLVVGSSSPQEDTAESSLAGRFDSVLDVRGWEEFRAAVRTVLDSARQPDGDSAPMAVLVQPPCPPPPATGRSPASASPRSSTCAPRS
ncbi:PEP/pyruvate-binding domain-containing protein [Streptomyces europaeiscabiei]|uniref:PEP/pyruvate-binding domain-containing protein n=1 Tax=Streptomyces europaeiscabiei TaxID=146819 RepID=A0ABU4NIZ4_9ACTN|nr:PEP/pyruvate-binding domain-containing protein [Streptomyces europaeiscabiei]MDX2762554.1 PEP/pyruvate-binding domain-containing protein [Streptomyces europaeiscabiei]MDX3543666.1 PEP/pyruvate-binding domain-containing protein [Streptomyces europaeiscabiei]MDX3553497.1 PEP/pyruvate-binding domain-containing protein [Streptomyces europaeiscabiei]MDX3669398.1 PEP/pyruvate-binding domain-containing protein [Streptomyces europaeiscabiei]MDX3701599.1 PEP/pyruvate-binding domain-containing protei